MKKAKNETKKPLSAQEKCLAFLKSPIFKVFLGYLALIFAAFCGFLNQTLISDNVLRMDQYDQMSLGEFMSDGTTSINGRWGNIVYWLIHAPLSKLGFTYEHNQWIYFVIDFIVLAIALTIIYSVFARFIKDDHKRHFLLFLAVALIAVNPFMVESLAFMIPSHPQALLCTALAIYFLASNHKRRYLWTILMSIATICTYQSYYSHLFVLGTIVLYLKNQAKIEKSLGKEFLKHLGAIAIGMASYFVSVFIYCKIANVKQAKGTTLSSPLHLLRELIHVLRATLEELWRNCGIYHLRGILVAILVAAAILLIAKLIQSHRKRNIIYGLFFIVIAAIAPVAYGAISTDFYLAPRILISYFTVLAGFLILIIHYRPSTKTSTALMILLTLFTAANIFQSSSLITDIQISNRIELGELEVIYKQIESYEATSGQTVDTVVVYNSGRVGEVLFDQTHTNHPDGYITSHLITGSEWSNVAWLQKITGRKFQHIEKSACGEEVFEVFPSYEPEQLTRFVPTERIKFDQNTLYWVTY